MSCHTNYNEQFHEENMQFGCYHQSRAPWACRTFCMLLLWINAGLSALLRVSAAQVILPGRNPEVYLPARCDGFALNGLHHGLVYSHTDTDHYSPNSDCTIFFSLKANQVVHFKFEHFSLQNRIRGKCVDYVQFFAGELLDKPLTEPLCGQIMPRPLSYNYSRIALLFRSNSNHETKGFRMRFVRSDVTCDVNNPDCVHHGGNYSLNRTRTSYLPALPAIFLIFPALMFSLAIWLHCS